MLLPNGKIQMYICTQINRWKRRIVYQANFSLMMKRTNLNEALYSDISSPLLSPSNHKVVFHFKWVVH